MHFDTGPPQQSSTTITPKRTKSISIGATHLFNRCHPPITPPLLASNSSSTNGPIRSKSPQAQERYTTLWSGHTSNRCHPPIKPPFGVDTPPIGATHQLHPRYGGNFITNERAGTIQKTSNFRMKNHPLEWKTSNRCLAPIEIKNAPMGGFFWWCLLFHRGYRFEPIRFSRRRPPAKVASDGPFALGHWGIGRMSPFLDPPTATLFDVGDRLVR
jgi:hypothetical protein